MSWQRRPCVEVRQSKVECIQSPQQYTTALVGPRTHSPLLWSTAFGMSRLVLCVLVAGMMVAGCANTLLLKYQDTTCDALEDGSNSGCASFPVLQTFMMFIGESLCFVVVAMMQLARYFRGRKDGRISRLLVPADRSGDYSIIHGDDAAEYNDDNDDDTVDDLLSASMHKESTNPELRGVATLYLALPAIFDICGTTIGSVGLLLVPASVYQMCRGSLALFVGLFSVVFLNRRLALYQWIALLLITIGVFIVGLSSVVGDDEATTGIVQPNKNGQHSVPAPNTLFGVLLIAAAQLFTASQFVLEEWILSKYSIEPLKVAGFEGVFGTIVTLVAMVAAYFVYGNTSRGENGTFDIAAGLTTIFSSGSFIAAFMVFAVCIASYNFFGLSVTRSVSATSRSTIDSCRTLVIWLVSMSIGWESFKWLQLLGFGVLVYSTLVFNGALNPPRFLRAQRAAEIDTTMVHTLE